MVMPNGTGDSPDVAITLDDRAFQHDLGHEAARIGEGGPPQPFGREASRRRRHFELQVEDDLADLGQPSRDIRVLAVERDRFVEAADALDGVATFILK